MHKMDGTQTYHLAKEMIPVYAIAITQERYFEDDRMYHSFSLRDDESYEELKVYFKGIKEKRNLMRMAFLELDKYDPTKIKQYKKVRWIEFFGNKPYTQNPETILETADMIMNRTGWTEEERTMYDDRTRKLDGYYAHLEYVAEEKQLARMEGIEKGIEEGIEKGAIITIVGLIKDGILTIESGAKRLNMSESELTAYLLQEEQMMYDDRTRKLDGYYAHLEYVAEEKQLARMEGIEKGIEEGIKKGRVEGRAEGAIITIVGLIRKGLLSIENGAQQLNISESELISYMQ